MAQQRVIRDGVFWGVTGAFFAAVMAGLIGYVFANFYGAGWISGGALALLVFTVAGLILARTGTASNLPPPNMLKSPVAPLGGAWQAPPGGKFRAPDAPPPGATPRREAAWAPERTPERTAEPAPSLGEMGHSAGEAVGKAAYTASAAVTSAAQAARAAIAGVVGTDEAPAKADAGPPRAREAAPPPSDAGPPPATEAPPPPATLEDVAPAEAAIPAPPGVAPVRPAAMDAAREGGPDDLKRIRGVGPKLEEMLHGLGFYHFDQIAHWTEAELVWVDSHLDGFNGRATRDDWVGQAKILAAGGETDFSRRAAEDDAS